MRWRILLSGSAAPFLCEIQIAFLCDLRTREFCCEIALIECTCTEEGGGRKRGRDEGNEGGRGSFARCPIRLADANVARKKRLNQNFKIYFRGTVLEEKHNKEGTEIKKKKGKKRKVYSGASVWDGKVRHLLADNNFFGSAVILLAVDTAWQLQPRLGTLFMAHPMHSDAAAQNLMHTPSLTPLFLVNSTGESPPWSVRREHEGRGGRGGDPPLRTATHICWGRWIPSVYSSSALTDVQKLCASGKNMLGILALAQFWQSRRRRQHWIYAASKMFIFLLPQLKAATFTAFIRVFTLT